MTDKYIGMKSGKLTAVEYVRTDVTAGGQSRPVYRFACECGAEIETRLYSVRSKRTSSCGCSPRPTKHGAAINGRFTPEYRAYRNMLTRGRNPNIKHSERYVLRGITVATEWLPGSDGSGFKRFFSHIGPKPSPKHTLDRIDNDRGYEPGNVRWATPAEQLMNRSTTRTLTVNGVTKPLLDWAAEACIAPSIISQRIDKLGWSEDRAISTPPKPDKRRKEAA